MNAQSSRTTDEIPVADLVRQYFAAYVSKEQAVIEALLGDDFTFTSPLDAHIDRAAYFKRC
ncbi:MAG: nuclear transport factor 2 family protein, partial [Rhodoferax sp.]